VNLALVLHPSRPSAAQTAVRLVEEAATRRRLIQAASIAVLLLCAAAPVAAKIDLSVFYAGPAGGVRTVLSAPVGFVSDHLEVLYDLDIEARAEAERLGLQWARAPMPNVAPRLIEALVNVVECALAAPRPKAEAGARKAERGYAPS